MKVVILAGGKGTRFPEETESRPKPMVEIGNKPILWHIMKHYRRYGFDQFWVALGYKGEVIKKYFLEECTFNGSMTVGGPAGSVHFHNDSPSEDWIVHLMNTGPETMTGGRIKRLQKHLQGAPFMVTYGDGVSNVDLKALQAFHKEQGKLATLTAVRPPARFGGLLFDGDLVHFTEKPQAGEGWINGGFLVCEPGIFDYLEGDDTVLEVELLERLAADKQLAAYRHDGFWQCMDTLREKQLLEKLWNMGDAPWKTWED